MGEQPHVGLFGPAVAAGTSLRLPTWRGPAISGWMSRAHSSAAIRDELGAAFHRHVAPSGEAGRPGCWQAGGAFWLARPGSGQRHAMTVRVVDCQAEL